MTGRLTLGRARPGLLVSVRSAEEARAAVLGGASVVDVKEPARGPLGNADPEVWRLVRSAVPEAIPVTVALGELRDHRDRPAFTPAEFAGIAARKIGLAGLRGGDWPRLWADVRRDLGPGPPWVAVAYLDDKRADAPSPEEVRDRAIAVPECVGLLLDTWDKSRPADPRILPASWCDPVRRSGRFVAVAGGLDAEAIRLLPTAPDLVAVRGAACRGGDRGGVVDPARVRALCRAVAAIGRPPGRIAPGPRA